MANRNFASGGKIYSMHVMPVLIDCNFVVDPTDTAGYGITDLKGPTVDQVYMATSATPAGDYNPASGVIVVQLADNYSRMFNTVSASIQSPLSGSPVTSTTANTAYVITSLGTATLAQWQAKGFPAGFTPSVGASFIATASGTIGGSAEVDVTATAGSNITDIQVVGDGDETLSNTQSGVGAQIILQCFKNGAKAAPATGSKISLQFYLSNSSITIQGE
jgi:hypothetical protein